MVLILELTCPLEENLVAAQERKIRRYRELMSLVKQHRWTPRLFHN